jgi:transketolase
VTCGTLGSTHYAIEDIGVLRCIPNIVILSPADGLETFKSAWAAVEYDGPVYIRLSGGKNLKSIYTNDYDFAIGKSVEIKDGSDISIFATGLMVSRSLEAAKLLEEEGIFARVINMHTIKPIDESAIIKAINETQLIVTVEEHTKTGGLGSAVAEIMAEHGSATSLFRISLQDEFPHIGKHEQILTRYGLTGSGIFSKISKHLRTISG